MIETLVRKHLRSFSPYTSARSEVQKADLLLDANELSLGSSVTLDGIGLNRYPDPNQTVLRGRIGGALGIEPESVFVGSGSDEIIDLLIRLVCDPGRDNIVVVEPTYGVYRVAANVSGVEVRTAELNESFGLDLDRTLHSVTATTKIVFVCSPNNPTGNTLDKNTILELCKRTEALVVVDQAYVEFADASKDLRTEVAGLENLVVLRTLSKAWGLAGIRLGYCLAHPALVSYLLRIKAPYNINAVTAKLALEALGNRQFISNAIDVIQAERTRMRDAVSVLPGVRRVYPSEANFILVGFEDADAVYQHLAHQGFIVRRRSEPRLKNCLRITIGSHDENGRLLKALTERA